LSSSPRSAFRGWMRMKVSCETADIHSLQLLLLGEVISIRRSQVLLTGLLGNKSFERSFVDCSKADIWMNLSKRWTVCFCEWE
jgi:hypothetical protein